MTLKAAFAQVSSFLLLLVCGPICASEAKEGRGCYMTKDVEGFVAGYVRVTEDACGRAFHFMTSISDFHPMHTCSGIAIGPKLVLTTANCSGETGKLPVVRAGIHNWSRVEDNQVITVKERIIYEHQDGTKGNGPNLALLKLTHEVKSYIPFQDLISLEECTKNNISMLGWFRNAPLYGPSPNLLAVDTSKLDSVSDNGCKTVFGELPEGVFCAKTVGTPNPIYDEAAALLCGGNRLIGVLSRAVLETNPVYMFTSAGHFRKWIEEKGKEEKGKEEHAEL